MTKSDHRAVIFFPPRPPRRRRVAASPPRGASSGRTRVIGAGSGTETRGVPRWQVQARAMCFLARRRPSLLVTSAGVHSFAEKIIVLGADLRIMTRDLRPRGTPPRFEWRNFGDSPQLASRKTRVSPRRNPPTSVAPFVRSDADPASPGGRTARAPVYVALRAAWVSAEFRWSALAWKPSQFERDDAAAFGARGPWGLVVHASPATRDLKSGAGSPRAKSAKKI